MKSPSILRLFDSPATGLISWFLLVYKELTASQIANFSSKNLSTITRTLKKMEKADLIHVSRKEQVKNLSVKYWRLNPSIKLENAPIHGEELRQLPFQEQQQVLNQVQNILLTFREITRSIFDLEITRITDEIKRKKKIEEEGCFILLLLDKDDGSSFNQELKELTHKFTCEKTPQSNETNIDLDNYLFILISSRVKDLLPPLD
jgi:DNA-binding MarR family transcriptional regulator